MGTLLESRWDWVRENSAGEPPLLMPVPLHASRQRERGFNQAELLARGLRGALGKRDDGRSVRLETRALRRTRPTISQTGLSLRQRKENVRGVFSVTAPQGIAGRLVVLVDDVMTTGATVSECAGALKQAGAREVLALTLARATPQFPGDDSDADTEPVDDSAHVRR
jgi:ComF family protein